MQRGLDLSESNLQHVQHHKGDRCSIMRYRRRVLKAVVGLLLLLGIVHFAWYQFSLFKGLLRDLLGAW